MEAWAADGPTVDHVDCVYFGRRGVCHLVYIPLAMTLSCIRSCRQKTIHIMSAQESNSPIAVIGVTVGSFTIVAVAIMYDLVPQSVSEAHGTEHMN